MKAAILHQSGAIPRYQDFPDPVPEPGQQLIQVTAAAIKNLDRSRVGGKHYASYNCFPTTVGVDGVGLLEDGTRVYAQGITGMFAQKALALPQTCIALPDALDDITAAALPNALLGSAAALYFRARIRQGETVLINGATGVTGIMAVQAARHLGAAHIIVTGRNPESLQRLKALGADKVLSLQQESQGFISQLQEIQTDTPITLILDYLWGPTVEWILTALQGKGISHNSQPLRLVTIGAMAGEKAAIPSAALRSADITLLGSGFGSLSPADLNQFYSDLLPRFLQLAAQRELSLQTQTADLQDIETVWPTRPAPGTSLVIRIPQ